MNPLKKHIAEIRDGGITVVLRKARNLILPKILVILMFPESIAIGIILRLFQPWVKYLILKIS